MTSDQISMIVLGILIGVGNYLGRRNATKKAAEVAAGVAIDAAEVVSKSANQLSNKTDEQTQMIEAMIQPIIDKVTAIDERLSDGHEAIAVEVAGHEERIVSLENDAMAARRILPEHAAKLENLGNRVLLIEQAGAMRASDKKDLK